MSIGILIVCTGKYDIFFKDLYESSEKYFLKSKQLCYQEIFLLLSLR